jgi:hypothetical protein
MPLPDHYPFAAVETSTLLEWAHMAEPPYEDMRKVAPWLKHESEIRSYLNGVVEGQIHYWRYGPLFGSSAQ